MCFLELFATEDFCIWTFYRAKKILAVNPIDKISTLKLKGKIQKLEAFLKLETQGV